MYTSPQQELPGARSRLSVSPRNALQPLKGAAEVLLHQAGSPGVELCAHHGYFYPAFLCYRSQKVIEISMKRTLLGPHVAETSHPTTAQENTLFTIYTQYVLQPASFSSLMGASASARSVQQQLWTRMCNSSFGYRCAKE